MADHHFLSRPIRLHWAGWETDTYRLQQAGWSLSADQDIMSFRMRIAMRHEAAQMRAISAPVDFDFHRNFSDPRYLDHIVLPVQALGRDVSIHMHGAVEWKFQPIDAQPQFIERKVSRLDDLVHFAPSLARTQEIILPEDSVPDLLERIRKLQEPARIERLKQSLAVNREGMSLDAYPRQKFHAQMSVSIAV